MAYPKIESERRGVVLQRPREKSEGSAIPSAQDFEALLKPLADGSIEALLINFILPPVKDPSIFQESRIIVVLKELRELLPQLFPQTQESSEGAIMAIDDEIARYSDLLERRHGGIQA